MLVSRAGTGRVVRSRGRLDKTAPLLRPCLAALRLVLGPVHRQTLPSVARLDERRKDRARLAPPDTKPPSPSGP